MNYQNSKFNVPASESYNNIDILRVKIIKIAQRSLLMYADVDLVMRLFDRNRSG